MGVMYRYILGQYVLGAFSKDDLTVLVGLNRITVEERTQIINFVEG